MDTSITELEFISGDDEIFFPVDIVMAVDVILPQKQDLGFTTSRTENETSN